MAAQTLKIIVNPVMRQESLMPDPGYGVAHVCVSLSLWSRGVGQIWP